MAEGTVFSIEEFSVYDGPGIRTTVFLKGCPLRCTRCHNPEGQDFEACIVRSPNGCVGCNECINSAQRIRERIVFTEESIKKCPMNLLRRCGETISGEELVRRIMKNARLLAGGGVTFSGGGPLTIEVHDSVLRNDIGVEKVAAPVKHFIDMGGHQLQINSVNREVLPDAKKHPEKYPNLIVRVWGWSGYFNELDPEYQNHIIKRCEFTSF